jgi:glucose-6-phosphate-specific signal transduction histidine kinase
MRVYVPDKHEKVISEILKDLYLLKQSIEHQSGTKVSQSDLVEKIRLRLYNMLDEAGN